MATKAKTTKPRATAPATPAVPAPPAPQYLVEFTPAQTEYLRPRLTALKSLQQEIEAFSRYLAAEYKIDANQELLIAPEGFMRPQSQAPAGATA